MTGLRRPRVVAFDIVETTFSIEPLGERLVALGLPAGSHRRLYAETLRDAVSLACTGGFAPFVEVFAGQLAILLVEHGLDPDAGRIRDALTVLSGLPPQPGAVQAFARLHGAGIAVVALSNGAAAATTALLEAAGMTGSVAHVLSVESVRLAKPRREVYLHATAVAGVRPDEAMLVACHPWDVTGAKAAGLAGAYVGRGKPFPPAMTRPDLEGRELADVAEAILRLPG